MATPANPRALLKFLVASAFFFFVGTVHGVVQVIPSVRHWLDSIGSPYGGPGHMIDPLAHAHINVVGGVVLLCMAVTYYLFHVIGNGAIYSWRLVNHTFWWTALGVCGFYSTLLIFGILEGHYLLAGDSEAMAATHRLYGPVIALISTAMGVGFWVFFINVFLTAKRTFSQRP